MNSVKDLWPDFQLPPPPTKNKLVKLLVEFAKGLSGRLDGRVIAKIDTLPCGTDENPMYAFRFVPRGKPKASVMMFHIEVFDDDSVRIDLTDKIALQEFKTKKEIIKFMKFFANSRDTRSIIQRLAQLANTTPKIRRQKNQENPSQE